jgi:heterodisulfide reductase subunit A
LAFTIDRDVCIGCGLCEKVCLANAVCYDDRPRRSEVEVGAVVIATGNEVLDPSYLDTYGYRESPNVVTSMEFERILSASGPFQGHLMRPFDREEPKKVAWIQCVGSRSADSRAKPYCSGVCCMYAIKEAVIAKEHTHADLDAAIFYMDMRTYGKEFEEYYMRAEKEYGVRFIRSRIHSVEPVGDGDLNINYVEENGKAKSEKFNLVVLSVGFEVGDQTVELAHRLGVELDKYSFAKTESFMPVTTSRPGIYVCGAFQGPKDIPQSVTEASAAAAASSVLLNDTRWTQTKKNEIPAQTNVSGERPRIGVFVCQCGINIGGIIDVPAVREYSKTLPHVVYVEDNLYTCSQDTQIKISQIIKEKGINRVVVAACTPKTHEILFQETLMNAGLNKYLFEMANIRNQDSWVHFNDRRAATEKAKDLVRMAVAKATLLEPLPETELDLNPVTLVVGGGISGMVAAKNLADQGYEVHLVEQSSQLGGNANFLYTTWKGEDIQEFLKRLIDDIDKNPCIHVHCSTELSNVEGFVGNFTSTLTRGGSDPVTLQHGLAIIATGGKEFKPKEYAYGEDSRVLTHLELDRRFIENDASLRKIRSAVFIQCVGSRESGRPYCSRVCCTHSMKSALELKRRNPEMAIYVLYRDLRTYGEREELYTLARKEGVLFIRYDIQNKPRVKAENDILEIEVSDPILERRIKIHTDLLILGASIEPSENKALASQFKIPVSSQGFFIEAHAKLRPVDFATEGVFLCGLAHYPKSLDESISQALAAAARAGGYLAAGKVKVSGEVAEIDPVSCSLCGVCMSVCPFGAPSVTEKRGATINPALCKGCGLCVASCRSGAIHLKGFDDSQIMAMINQI